MPAIIAISLHRLFDKLNLLILDLETIRLIFVLDPIQLHLYKSAISNSAGNLRYHSSVQLKVGSVLSVDLPYMVPVSRRMVSASRPFTTPTRTKRAICPESPLCL